MLRLDGPVGPQGVWQARLPPASPIARDYEEFVTHSKIADPQRAGVLVVGDLMSSGLMELFLSSPTKWSELRPPLSQATRSASATTVKAT